ncbi:MAG: UvrD-helicase domain-containing protein [bacterium]
MIKPTKEQKKIFLFTEKRFENLLIKARAGSGKTWTAINCAKLLPKDKSIMFLAFNKHIKEELKVKLPDYIRCYTTYGLGLSAIKRKYGDKIEFDEFKLDKIIQKKSKSWDLDIELKDNNEITNYLNNIKKLVNLCRLSLTLKPEYIPFLADKHDINLRKSKDIKRVVKILDEFSRDRKTYDYTDMVFLPAIDNGIWMFPQDYVIIDEYQDTNRCQVRIIEKILKKDRKTGKTTGRLFVFGDDYQQIYGFNGSDEHLIKWYEKFPNTKTLPLTTSFRCAKNIIEKAKKIVPDIEAMDGAPDGIVREGSVINEANSGDFVLCRTTMPLVKLFFEFLSKHKKVVIKGRDIGIHLIELIGSINNLTNLDSFWTTELNKFREDLKSSGILDPNEHSGYATLQDKVNTLLFLAKLSDSIVGLKEMIKTIFTDEIKGIVLSTVHKVKGLEANKVFIIRPDILPMKNVKGWQHQQEINLEYVAITRAKLELIYDNEWSDE